MRVSLTSRFPTVHFSHLFLSQNKSERQSRFLVKFSIFSQNGKQQIKPRTVIKFTLM